MQAEIDDLQCRLERSTYQEQPLAVRAAFNFLGSLRTLAAKPTQSESRDESAVCRQYISNTQLIGCPY